MLASLHQMLDDLLVKINLTIKTKTPPLVNIKIAGIGVHPFLSPENDQWYFEALIHGHFKNKRPVRSIFGCAFSCIAASGFSTPEAPDKTSCWFQPFFNQFKKCGSSIGIMLPGLCEKSNMLTNIHQRGHHWYLYYYSASYICMTHTHTHPIFRWSFHQPNPKPRSSAFVTHH